MSVPVTVAVAAGALILAVPVVVAAQSVAAEARASQAADASALAAADMSLGLIEWGDFDPCDLAAEVSMLNGTDLSSCVIEQNGGEARVSVTVQIGLFSVTKSAHAGPPGE